MLNTWNPAELNQKINQLEAAITTPEAEDIQYDNTTSGLTADDVQAAIDEIVANPVITKIEVTASTNASGKITISATDVPLDKLVSVIVKSPTGYNALSYRGSTSYGVVITEQGTVTPVASTECVLEITKLS